MTSVPELTSVPVKGETRGDEGGVGSCQTGYEACTCFDAGEDGQKQSLKCVLKPTKRASLNQTIVEEKPGIKEGT